MKFATLALGLILSLPAHAEPGSRPNAGGLLADCKRAIRILDGERASNQDYTDGSGCLAYLSGVRDALTMVYEGHGAGAVMCLPSEVTSSQLARVYVQWAESNPQLLHEDKLVGVLKAFFPKFACPEGG